MRLSAYYLAGLALVLSAKSYAAEIVVVPSTERVFTGTELGTRQAHISAARNEFESFQILIKKDQSALKGVQVTRPILTHIDGLATLSADDFRVYRVGRVHLPQASNQEGEVLAKPPTDVPDILFPDEISGQTVLLHPNQTSTLAILNKPVANPAFLADKAEGDYLLFLVEAFVPRRAPSGKFSGRLEVRSQDLPLGALAVEVTLEVYDFDLPQTSSLPAWMGYSENAVCKHHFAEQCDNATNEKWLALTHGRFLLDHRISIRLPDSIPAPSFLGTFLPTYLPLITGRESVSGLRQLDGAKLTALAYPKGRMWPMDKVPDWWSGIVQYGLRNENFDYTFDEPKTIQDFANMIDRADNIHKFGSDEFKTLVTRDVKTVSEILASNFDRNYLDVVNILVPQTYQMDESPLWGERRWLGDQRPEYQPLLGHHPWNALWVYQACPTHSCNTAASAPHNNWPNLMVDATATQARAQPWMHYIYDARGLLYYDVAAWADDIGNPLFLDDGIEGEAVWREGGNGEGILIYPGSVPLPNGDRAIIPLASVRLKNLRDGLEDYEYLLACEKHIGRDATRELALAAFPMSGFTGAGVSTGAMYSANTFGTSIPRDIAGLVSETRERLANDCIAPRGSGVPNGDPSFISAPVVISPLYECSSYVGLNGGIPGASAEVFDNGNLTGEAKFDSDGIARVAISSPLRSGAAISAKQKLDTETSDYSEPEYVRPLPSSLPTPDIVYLPLYECGRAIAADPVVPGGHIRFESAQRMLIAEYPVAYSGPTPKFDPLPVGLIKGESITAISDFCRDASGQPKLSSAPSRGYVVQPAIAPTPITILEAYPGSFAIRVLGAMPGARIDVKTTGGDLLGSHYVLGASPGDVPLAKPIPDCGGACLRTSQSLCPTHPPSESPPFEPTPCTFLPAPKVRRPSAGDTRIEVLASVTGARIRVVDGKSVEIGDGGGTAVQLKRALLEGEQLAIVQSVGACKGERVTAVVVSPAED